MDAQKRAVALAVLKKGKIIAGRSFPRFEDTTGQIEWEIVDMWAEELSQNVYPVELWSEAVSHWVNKVAQSGDVATTGDMLRAAKYVWGTWAERRDKRDLVEQFRLSRLDAKYRELVPGYKPGSVYPSPAGKELTDGEVIAQIAARVKRR